MHAVALEIFAFVHERDVHVAEQGVASRVLIGGECRAQRKSVGLSDGSRQEFHVLQSFSRVECVGFKQSSHQGLLVALCEVERLRVAPAFGILNVRVSGAEVNGKNQLFRRRYVGLPQRHSHGGERAQFAVQGHFDEVERAVDVVVCCLAESVVGACAFNHRNACLVHAVGKESQVAFSVAHLSELLNGVVVAMVGAHKWEYGSRHHAVCHNSSGAAAFVELPRGVGDGQVGSRQFNEFLFHRNAQAHLHAAVGVFLDVEHVVPEDSLGEVEGVEVFEESGR